METTMRRVQRSPDPRPARRWAGTMSICLTVLLCLSSVSAAGAAVNERPGLLRVMTAKVMPPGRMWTSFTGEWSSHTAESEVSYTQTESRGTVGMAVGLLSGVEASLSLPLRYYADDYAVEQSEFGQGDLQIGVTAGKAFGSRLHVALNTIIIAPVGTERVPAAHAKTALFRNDALQVGGGLLLTYDFAGSDAGIPLRTHVNARYLANFLELEGRPTTWNNLLLVGVAGEVDLGRITPFVEVTTEQPLHNYLLYAMMAPIRVTPGARVRTPFGVDLTLGIDVGLSQEMNQSDVSPEAFGPGFETGDNLVPPWNAVGGVSVSFPAWTPPPPPYGTVTGQVANHESGVPLEATVSFPETEIPSVSTDPSTGTFVVEVPEGSWKMVIAAEGYLWRAGRITVARGSQLVVNAGLRSRERALSTERAQARYQTVSQLLAQAQDLSAADSLYEALTLLQRAAHLAPNNIEVQGLLAQIEGTVRSRTALYRTEAMGHESAGRWREAAALWRKLLELDPDNAEAQEGLVAIERRLSSPARRRETRGSEASASRQAAAGGAGVGAPSTAGGAAAEGTAKLTSTQIRALYGQGVRAFTAEQYVRAADYFRQVLQAEPSHAGAQSYLARAEARLRRLKDQN